MFKLTIKKAERRHWCRSGVFIINFEYILQLVLVFLLLTLNMKLPLVSESLECHKGRLEVW